MDGLTIIDKNYEELILTTNKIKVLTVFNLENARLVFQYIPYIEFIICLNELNNTFSKCCNMVEVERFYNQ